MLSLSPSWMQQLEMELLTFCPSRHPKAAMWSGMKVGVTGIHNTHAKIISFNIHLLCFTCRHFQQQGTRNRVQASPNTDWHGIGRERMKECKSFNAGLSILRNSLECSKILVLSNASMFSLLVPLLVLQSTSEIQILTKYVATLSLLCPRGMGGAFQDYWGSLLWAHMPTVVSHHIISTIWSNIPHSFAS